MRLASVLGLLLLAVVAFPAGCESIAGIKDHAFPVQCESYCTDVQKCPSTTGLYSSLYRTKATCLGICTQLPVGGALEEQSSNTLVCRESQLTMREPDCASAAPGGGTTCGTDCEGYCSLLQSICPDFFSPDFPPSLGDPQALCRDSCERALARVPYNVDDPTISVADTVQCRMWHLSTATVEAGHCEHAQIHPNTQCADDPKATGYCTHYCKVNQAACQSYAYASNEECMAVCNALPFGAQDDSTGNTRACRLWHSYSALTLPTAHCPHTTAGGDGHCGTGNCESYCMLVATEQFKAQCPTEAAQLPTDCKSFCDALPGGGPNQWSTTVDGGMGTVPCLLQHLGRALAALPSSDAGPTECQMATNPAICQ